MSRENELDLDAILAEFHGETPRPAQPDQAPAPRRREAEPRPAPQPRESAPAMDREPRPAASQRREAAPRPRPAAPDREKPAQKPARRQAAPRPQRERRPASRGAKGRAHMAAVLALLAILLAGLLFWTVRAERKAAALEPEPIRLELGQELEDYLIHAATTTR